MSTKKKPYYFSCRNLKWKNVLPFTEIMFPGKKVNCWGVCFVPKYFIFQINSPTKSAWVFGPLIEKKNHQVIQIYKSDVDFYMQNKQIDKYFFLVIMIIDTHSMKACWA